MTAPRIYVLGDSYSFTEHDRFLWVEAIARHPAYLSRTERSF